VRATIALKIATGLKPSHFVIEVFLSFGSGRPLATKVTGSLVTAAGCR
jgi:hypothetical protein